MDRFRDTNSVKLRLLAGSSGIRTAKLVCIILPMNFHTKAQNAHAMRADFAAGAVRAT